jgi:hypothetical protein
LDEAAGGTYGNSNDENYGEGKSVYGAHHPGDDSPQCDRFPVGEVRDTRRPINQTQAHGRERKERPENESSNEPLECLRPKGSGLDCSLLEAKVTSDAGRKPLTLVDNENLFSPLPELDTLRQAFQIKDDLVGCSRWNGYKPTTVVARNG